MDVQIAPVDCRRNTPAEILATHPRAEEISTNLGHWRQAYEAGETDISNISPALLWVKVFEGKEPPPKPGQTKYNPRPPKTPVDYELEEAVALAEEVIADIPPEGGKLTTEEGLLDNSCDDTQVPPNPPGDGLGQVWGEILGRLQSRLAGDIFDGHLAGSQAVDRVGDVLLVRVKNPMSVDWINGRLKPVVEKAASEENIEIKFV